MSRKLHVFKGTKTDHIKITMEDLVNLIGEDEVDQIVKYLWKTHREQPIIKSLHLKIHNEPYLVSINSRW